MLGEALAFSLGLHQLLLRLYVANVTWALEKVCLGAVDPILGVSELSRREHTSESLTVAYSLPCSSCSYCVPSIAQDHRTPALPGGMLMSARHCLLLSPGCDASLPTFSAISPCFSPFSVPLSLSRTFAVSRTEVLAAGSPGNFACFLFVTPGKPGH